MIFSMLSPYQFTFSAYPVPIPASWTRLEGIGKVRGLCRHPSGWVSKELGVTKSQKYARKENIYTNLFYNQCTNLN